MRLRIREIIQGCCMIGFIFGLLLIDANFNLAAIITLGCVALFFLLEKGIM